MVNSIRNREVLNLLLEWGKTHLLTPEFSRHLKDLEEEYRALTQGVDVNGLLSNLLGEMESEIDNTIKVLSAPELITVVEDDDIYLKAEESFITLDRCIYFMEAVYYLIAKDTSGGYQGVLNGIDRMISKIITWLEDSNFSPLRLTVFNELRRAYLTHIPEEKRYLFPWYERASDLPDNTLRGIVENYNNLVSGKETVIPEELKPYHMEILYELKRDKELNTMLREEHTLHRALMEIAKEKSSINLWFFAEDMAFDYVIPEKIDRRGVVRVSTELIGKIMKNSRLFIFIEKPVKAYYLFLSAFCGPSLTNAQRLELFDKVETLIKEIGEDDLDRSENAQATLLRRLKRWYDGDNTELPYLGNTAFNQWESLLIKIAETMEETEFDSDPEEFWQILIRLAKMPEVPSIVVVVLNRIHRWKEKNVLNPQPVLSGVQLRMGITTELSINTNPISIFILPSSEQRYQLLPEPDSVSAPDEHRREYTHLWDGINPRIRGGIYAGGIILKDEKKEMISVQELTKREFYLVEGNFLEIFLGISDDKNQLRHFVKKLYEDREIEERHLDRVVVLEISLADTS